MPRICAVLPNWQSPLAQGLANHGLEVEHLWAHEAGSDYAHIVPIAGIDLLKALRATGADDLLLDLFMQLPANASRSAALFEGIVERKPDVVVVSYTADVCGKAALAAAKFLDVPVVHVSHFCASLDAHDAPFLRDAPGDVVCVGGERDRDWWKVCAPNADVRVTGLPQFDWTVGREPRQRPLKPTIAYVCESGTNAYQSPRVWQFRDVPERTWTAFLSAMKRIDRPVKVLLKARSGEDATLCNRWLREAQEGGMDVSLTDDHMGHVLPEVDYVLGQQTNAMLEAALCGVPTIANVTRPGVTMLEGEVPSVSGLAGDLDDRLLELIRDGLDGHAMTPTRCKEIAARYQVPGGGSMARVAEVVREVAAGKAAPQREREMVLA
jgi:hypothetical protein